MWDRIRKAYLLRIWGAYMQKAQAIIHILITLFLIKVVFIGWQSELTDNEKRELLTMFPEEHINSISLYHGSIIREIGGGAMASCGVVFTDEKYRHEIPILIHEYAHTLQMNKNCLNSMREGIILQFKRGGNNIYSYNISDQEFTMEQEAQIVQDWYYLNEGHGMWTTFCIDCTSDNLTLGRYDLLKSKILE